MSLTTRSEDGDTVDYIAWRHYGDRPGAAEAILAANQNLADSGPIFPAGIEITLPDLIEETTTEAISLWD